MPMVLDQVVEETIKPVDHKIADFALNLLRGDADIAYQKRDADGNALAEKLLPLTPVETQALIARINEIAGVDVYGPIKQAIHEAIATNEGKTGSIV